MRGRDVSHTYQVKESKIICNFLEIKELKERKK